MKRTIWILSLGQGLNITANVLVGTVLALASYSVIDDKALATLPMALMYVSSMLTTTPASFFMKHYGRRRGFVIGTLLGVLGGGVAALGMYMHAFAGICAGAALIGWANAFGFYYRFAVAEIADDHYRSRAISYVMAGGVMGAVFGPWLANATWEGFRDHPYAGSFLTAAAVYMVSTMMLFLIRIPPPGDWEAHHSGRPLRVIARQPKFKVALVSGVVGYGLMTFLMAATPLAMQACHHGFSKISFIIQWHVLGMFAPSFVTGWLIQKFGLRPVMLTGVVLNGACVLINLTGQSVSHFWIALVCLGIGWNFLYIGATTMLTETYAPEEKAKVQALNEFCVFFMIALSALSAGQLHHHLGWEVINGIAAPGIILVLIVLLRARDMSRVAPQAASSRFNDT